MRTIHEHLDDLDRMVDSDAPKDKVRSQIRLISREVAALEADYAGLAERHQQEVAGMAHKYSDLHAEHENLKSEHAKLKAGPPTIKFTGDPGLRGIY